MSIQSPGTLQRDTNSVKLKTTAFLPLRLVYLLGFRPPGTGFSDMPGPA
jgi:hypothetical protein